MNNCALHTDNFQLLVDLYKKLNEKEQREIIDLATSHVHDRHMIRIILHESAKKGAGSADNGPQITDDGRKRRKVYKLLDSSSTRSIARLYEQALQYLKQHATGCETTIDLHHVANDVQTNYTNGDDDDFSAEEHNLNPLSGHVQQRFYSIENATTMASHYDASRPIDVSFRFASSSAASSSSQPTPSSSNNQLIEYLTNPVHKHAIKLLDFVFVDARECWTLWNDVMDRAISVHRVKRMYPIKDSLYDVTVLYDRTERTIFPHHTHGLITKLGLLVDFVLSFRVLMQHSIIACCYAIKREAAHRTHYAKKHECQFPATSQGVYQELFLTSKYGHDLVCNLPVNSAESAVYWLTVYQETREMMLEKKKIDGFSDKLAQHLYEWNNRYGAHRLRTSHN
jgi:hypothetical protein